MPLLNRPLRLLIGAIVTSGMLLAGTASAETHGLVLAIGNYPQNLALPGIDKDARSAVEIASLMGVRMDNLFTVDDDRQLTLEGFRKALDAFAQKVKPGDNAFIYYSGHGGRFATPREGRLRCSESLITVDLDHYGDEEFEIYLNKLRAKAGKLVVFLDSCHSGGATAKTLKGKQVPKTADRFIQDARECEKVANAPKSFSGKNIDVTRSDTVYVAAARENEYSWATENGSSATRAWLTCLKEGAQDKDRSGAISAAEMAACAQGILARNPNMQHLVVRGATDSVMSYNVAGRQQPAVDPVAALKDIAASGDPKWAVSLRPLKDSFAIGRDFLDFEVETAQPGFLYLIHVGSDGKTFTQLFPNAHDENNAIGAGRHRLPREHWRLRAVGPAGTDHLLAIVSSSQRDFASLVKDKKGAFASVPASSVSAKNFVAEAVDRRRCGTAGAPECSNPGVERFGAALATVREVQ